LDNQEFHEKIVEERQKEKLRKRHVVIEVIICVLAAFSVPTLFIPFILVSVAFAYPVIVGRPKLLFIPISVAGAFFLIMFRLDGIEILLLLFAVISAFGVVAGLLIRHFRESRKSVKTIATIVGVVILFVPFLFIMEMFFGLLRNPLANMRVRRYIAQHYSDFDLRVGRSSYDFKDVSFNTRVYDRNNRDIHFNVIIRNGEVVDTFRSGGY